MHKRGFRLVVKDRAGAIMREQVCEESTVSILLGDLGLAFIVEVEPVRIHEDGTVERATVNGKFHSDGPYQTERG